MKKIILPVFLAVLCLLTLISCTQDATEGIFAQVVTQGSSAKYKIKQYIDCIDGNHFFIEVGGLYKNASCIKKGNFYESYLSEDKKDLYLLDSTGTITKYGGNDFANPANTDYKMKFQKLTANGYAVAAENSTISGIYKIDSGSLKPVIKSGTINEAPITNILWSGNTILVQTNDSDKDYPEFSAIKTYFYDTDKKEFKEIKSAAGRLILGFQKADSEYILLECDDDSNYRYRKLTVNGDTVTCDVISSTAASIPQSNVSQTPSFYDSRRKAVIFRCASYFDKIDLASSSPVLTAGISGGFATNIHTNTMEVVNMKVIDDEGNVIIAFYKYGLFKANADNNPSTAEVKF